jgi:aspartyl-tRNA synthetase
MYRTHNCGELNIKNVNQEVTLSGWIQKVRKLGSITFVDLRDRYGITQLNFNDAMTTILEEQGVGREYVVQVSGKVIERSSKNNKIPTGEIEIEVTSYTILNKSAVPPFTIEEETDGGDELRMKYRYLDLRRPTLQRNLALRYKVNRAVRNYLDSIGFFDIETPFLIKSTPEGARDFVVPSRMNPNEFYALPQSPQTFKQLLMVSGFDRYYQIVKCFRDEDLRADRQPEFTQIDCEMSFVEQEDVINTFEGLIKSVFNDVKNIQFEGNFPRMTWTEAMRKYGNDKPDIRYGMEHIILKAPTGDLEVTDEEINLVGGANFKVMDDAELVVALNVPSASEWTRKQIDDLTNWVKRPQIGMTGMMYVKYNTDGSIKSSIDKFYTPEILKTWLDKANAQPGDMLLILCGNKDKTRKAASDLRLELGNQLGLRKKDEYAPLWVVDFPLLEWADEDVDGGGAGRWVARHHPFTSPKPEQIEWMNDTSKYAYIKANAYDIVLNGHEIGGGSIRIFQKDLQQKMFNALGISPEEQEEKFGFLLGAFEFGAPPHGGLALGFDRLCALIGGDEVIRDYIAFPKNNSGRDTMLNAPDYISEKQLEELHLHTVK